VFKFMPSQYLVAFRRIEDTAKGNRPSFAAAAPPEEAERLYEGFCDALAGQGLDVARGRFGARMSVELANDGPVTIVLDADATNTAGAEPPLLS
jgi:D-aminoacyl-tRNA deacylase